MSSAPSGRIVDVALLRSGDVAAPVALLRNPARVVSLAVAFDDEPSVDDEVHPAHASDVAPAAGCRSRSAPRIEAHQRLRGRTRLRGSSTAPQAAIPPGQPRANDLIRLASSSTEPVVPRTVEHRNGGASAPGSDRPARAALDEVRGRSSRPARDGSASDRRHAMSRGGSRPGPVRSTCTCSGLPLPNEDPVELEAARRSRRRRTELRRLQDVTGACRRGRIVRCAAPKKTAIGDAPLDAGGRDIPLVRRAACTEESSPCDAGRAAPGSRGWRALAQIVRDRARSVYPSPAPGGNHT